MIVNRRTGALVLATCILSCAARAAAQSEMSSYPQLELSDVIARAIMVSPAVASGSGAVRSAQSLERVARGAYLPTLLATSAATRSDVSGSGISRNQTLGLSGAVDLFTGGRRAANSALARAELSAADATLISARFTVRLIAEQAFYEVIRATELEGVARAALAQSEQLLRFTTAMAPAGVVTRSDALRAQLQVTTARQQLLSATDTLRTATFALGWIVGAEGPVGTKADSASDVVAPLALDDNTILQLAAESSPEVVAARSILTADDAAVRAARSLYTPTISAGAAYNAATNSSSTSGTRPGWTLSAGTSYPLFNGFQREDAVTRARVNADVARVAAADASRSARASAAQLLGALGTTAATISLGTDAVRSAREDLRVQNARYRAGISTMLDVLTSQSALVQAEFSVAQARHRYHTTRAALEALLGRTL